jgi:hypothetical protein
MSPVHPESTPGLKQAVAMNETHEQLTPVDGSVPRRLLRHVPADIPTAREAGPTTIAKAAR